MSLKDPRRVHIRWMIWRDMPEILAIEQAVFPQTWDEQAYLFNLRNRSVIGMVGEVADRVVSGMVYELHPKHLHIKRLAVDASCQRQGIGYQMIQKLISKLSSHRRTAITINVRERNLPAQLFFRTCRFKASGVERGFFKDTGEDAYPMIYWLDDADQTELILPSDDVGNTIEIDEYVASEHSSSM